MSLLINWRLYGFVRIIMAFIIGILIADILQWSVSQLLSIALVGVIAILLISKLSHLDKSLLKSSLLLQSFIIAGSLFYINNNPLLSKDHFSQDVDKVLIEFESRY